MGAVAVPVLLIVLAALGIGFLAGLLVGERLGYMAAVRWLEQMGGPE